MQMACHVALNTLINTKYLNILHKIFQIGQCVVSGMLSNKSELSQQQDILWDGDTYSVTFKWD